EADERGFPRKLPHENTDGFIDRRQRLVDRLHRLQRGQPFGRGERGQPRPLAGDEPEIGAKGLRQEENVGEEDRGIEAVAADRLERDLGGKIRRVAERQEIPRLLARRPVLRQVASRLPHHPDRRNGQGFAGEGAEDRLLHGASCAPLTPGCDGMSRQRQRAAIARAICRGYALPMQMPDAKTPLKIGTRGSPLALAQAHETRARLMAMHGLPEDAFEIVVIKTTGDDRALIAADRPLKEIGGKGLFTKEIEDALLSGGIDIAVDSMKDMPVVETAGLVLDCHLPREDVRDAFVTPAIARLADLPEGAVVGSSSLRRRAQLAHRRPDLRLVQFRGNVQTRLKKLHDGVAAATFPAMAALNRLGM